MTYRTLLFQLLITLFCTNIPITLTAGMLPSMQMHDIEKELAEANKAIEEYVSNLSADEQAEFNRAVEDMAQMFENMTEEEFEKFLGEMFAEEPMPQPAPFEPTPVSVQPVIEVPALTADQKKKVDTALTVLNDIIRQTNVFIVLVHSSPELPNRISQWGKKGTLTNWPADMNWSKLQIELEKFSQQLHRTEDKDLTTYEYKFLLELIADEALYNNIIQLQTSLNSLVPTINIPDFNVQKLSASTKTTIQNVINKYTESMYVLTIPKALDALFEKYEPQAKKIREAEEAANKRALDASKGQRSPASETQAGMESEFASYGSDYSSRYGSDYGYSSPYGSDYDYGYSPDYGSYGSNYGSSGSNAGGGGGGGRSSGGESSGSSDSEKKEDEDKKDKAPSFVHVPEIERIIGKIEDNFKEIHETMINPDHVQLQDLAQYIHDKEEVDDTLASLILPIQIDKKVTAIRDNIKTIDAKKMNSDARKAYQKEVQKIVDKNKKDLETLRASIDRFELKTDEQKKAEAAKKPVIVKGKEVKEEAEENKIDVSLLSAEKRWAYFGDKDDVITDKAKLDKLQEEIPTRKSLFEIKDNIDKLFEEVKKFVGKKVVTEMVEVKKTPDLE